MKKLTALLLQIYPASWRDRYALELEALLEDLRPGWRDTFDLFKGALTMRLDHSRYLKTAAICGLAGALLCGAFSLTLPDRFVSSATIAFRPGESGASAADTVGRTAQRVLSRASLSTVISREHLYEHDGLGNEAVIEKMRRDIHVGIPKRPANAFEVVFIYPDAAKAHSVATELATRFTQEQSGFQTLDAPQLPKGAVSPNRWVILALGLSGGLLTGLAIARFRRPPTPYAC